MKTLKKFLVYGRKQNGVVERYQCFANSYEEAENKVLRTWNDLIEAEAFDWAIQFS